MRTSLSASSSSSSSSSLESSMFAFCFLGRGCSSSPSNSSSSSLPSSASRSNKLAVVMADVNVMFCCKLSGRRFRRVDVVGRQFVAAAAESQVMLVWKLRLPSRPWRLRPAELRQDQSQLPELAIDDSSKKGRRKSGATRNRSLSQVYPQSIVSLLVASPGCLLYNMPSIPKPNSGPTRKTPVPLLTTCIRPPPKLHDLIVPYELPPNLITPRY
ncbi:hypothetical protein KCU65_g178, partial [Aureobasidium melanogenum]